MTNNNATGIQLKHNSLESNSIYKHLEMQWKCDSRFTLTSRIFSYLKSIQRLKSSYISVSSFSSPDSFLASSPSASSCPFASSTQCGAIVLASPQYASDNFGVLSLTWITKRHKLSEWVETSIYLYRNSHVCNVFEKSLWTKKASAFIHRKAVQYDTLVIPAIRT